MNRSKIEWTDYTWNPVTGCQHGCPYCYAARKSQRFCGDIRLNKADPRCRGDKDKELFILEKPFGTNKERVLSFPFGFSPTLHRYRMDLPGDVKLGANVFVCSMADLFGDWVPLEWIEEVFQTCERYPQHNYLFLTKNPKRYTDLIDSSLLPCADNFWYGTTITAPGQPYFSSERFNTFLSIEPLLRPMGKEDLSLDGIDWVIIGAMTGPGSKRYQPDREWVANIREWCRKQKKPVFIKDNLLSLMGEDFVQELPPGIQSHGTAETTSRQESFRRGYCNFCGTEAEKKDMVALLYRKKRGDGAKSLGYACPTCFQGIKEAISSGQVCEIRTVQNDEKMQDE